jgi:hypothetical protein
MIAGLLLPPRGARRAAVALLALAGVAPIAACECFWVGPFLTVAPACSSIVRARVLEHHGGPAASRSAESMDLDIREVLRGRLAQRRLRVWGDNGMLCRPPVTQFPIGTEWVFALNGPGSKPGMSPGPSISVCGTYWLRVADGTVVGNLDDPSDVNASQPVPLDEFRARLTAAIAAADSAAPRAWTAFEGEVGSGESFAHPFGAGLEFRLEPQPLGWRIAVRQEGRDEDLARLTPPFHFVPNPREIEGWHFRNADNTGPNEPGEQSVNAPGAVREFVFSPDVGRTIAGPSATASVSPDDVDAVRRFGEGTLTILEYRLTPPAAGAQAGMEWMRFRVELSWLAGR